MKRLFWAVIVLIVYGSLYPLNFSLHNPHHLSLHDFLMTFFRYSGDGDTLGNLFLFMPMTAVGRLAWPKASTLRLLLSALLLAVVLQILQIWLPSRVPSLQDACVNEVGAMLGFLFIRIPVWFSRKKHYRFDKRARYPMLLLALWLGYRLVPFVPSINWQSWKDSLKPLLLHPTLPWVQVLLSIASWAVISAIWDLIWVGRHPRIVLGSLILASFVAEVVIVDNSLTATNVLGAVAGFLLWPLLRQGPKPYAILASFLLVSFVLEELTPFKLRSHGINFHWVPFWGFLNGNLFINLESFLQKLFIYGSLIWLCVQAGIRFTVATITVAISIFILVIAQGFFVGHVGDITGVLMALGIGWVMLIFERDTQSEIRPT